MNRAIIRRLAGHTHFDDYFGVIICRETGFENHGELHLSAKK